MVGIVAKLLKNVSRCKSHAAAEFRQLRSIHFESRRTLCAFLVAHPHMLHHMLRSKVFCDGTTVVDNNGQ